MVTVLCILWVANMAFACSSSNEVWYLNAVSAIGQTVAIAAIA